MIQAGVSTAPAFPLFLLFLRDQKTISNEVLYNEVTDPTPINLPMVANRTVSIGRLPLEGRGMLAPCSEGDHVTGKSRVYKSSGEHVTEKSRVDGLEGDHATAKSRVDGLGGELVT